MLMLQQQQPPLLLLTCPCFAAVKPVSACYCFLSTSQSEEVGPAFFAALAHVRQIHANCKALLRTHHQRAGRLHARPTSCASKPAGQLFWCAVVT